MAPSLATLPANSTAEADGNQNDDLLAAWIASHGGAADASDDAVTWSHRVVGSVTDARLSCASVATTAPSDFARA